jgi:hypothetical protein
MTFVTGTSTVVLICILVAITARRRNRRDGE